ARVRLRWRAAASKARRALRGGSGVCMRKAQISSEKRAFVGAAAAVHNIIVDSCRMRNAHLCDAERWSRAMTYAARPNEFVPCDHSRPEDRGGTARRPGLLRRIYDAVLESRQKQAERVVANYLQGTGGRFTDDIERRVIERLISGEWRR